MAPEQTASSLPLRLQSIDNELAMADTHTFPLADYVVIHQCDPPCTDCEFIKVSKKEVLQLSLKEEKKKNEKYRERLNDILKKYGQSLRQIECQKARIQFLTRQLVDEKRGTNALSDFKVVAKGDFTVIEQSTESLEDDDLVHFGNKLKLEILTE